MGNKNSKTSKPNSIGIDYAGLQAKRYSKSDIKLVLGSMVSYRQELREEEESRRRVKEERERRRKIEEEQHRKRADELQAEKRPTEERLKQSRSVATVHPYNRKL